MTKRFHADFIAMKYFQKTLTHVSSTVGNASGCI